MNKERRKRLASVTPKLEEVKEELKALHEEEQKAFDNLPESLQDSERGEQMNDCIDMLDDAVDEIACLIDTLKECAKETMESSVDEAEYAAKEKAVFSDLYGNKYTADELVLIATGKKMPLDHFEGKIAGEWEE